MMSVSAPSSTLGATSAGQRDRLAVPAILLAIAGAGGMLLVAGTGIGANVALEVGIPLGVWFVGRSVLGLLAYAASTVGLLMGAVVATRSRVSRRAGCAAVAIAVVISLMCHLFWIGQAVVLAVEEY